MARGTQHRKRRPAANARGPRGSASVASPGTERRKPPQWQEELFFSRLRVHAKWVFVGLAVVFALGFVVFGVGSGSTGISSALQNAFNFGGGGGSPSISSLERKVAKQPSDAQAWQSLATAYQQKGRTADAVNALQRYVALRPKDADGLTTLASEQTQLASEYGTQLQTLATNATAIAPQFSFAPSSTSSLGKLFNDPIVSAVQQSYQSQANALQAKLTSMDAAAETSYRQLVALDPKNATNQLSLGQAAQTAGDYATSVKAYEAFLKLAPSDPLASQVRKAVKQLKTAAAASSSASSSPSG